MTDALTFARALVGVRPGATVRLRAERGSRDVLARIAAMSRAERELARRIGLEFDALTTREDERLLRDATVTFYSGSGRRRVPTLPVALRVRHVYPESPAAELGFETGDVVLGTRMRSFLGQSDRPLASIDDLADRARDAEGRDLFVIVMRDREWLGGELFVRRT